MTKKRLAIALVVLLALALIAGAARAQVSAGYDLSWFNMAGGGGRAASASYALDGTIGQALAGPSASATYQLNSGYWQNWPNYVYLPVIQK